jgi:hypothetical protein
MNVLRNSLLGLVFLCAAAGGAETYYVSVAGDDANPGAKDKPFMTVQKARDAVRAARDKATGPITVLLLSGTYYLSEPLVFTPADSGTKAAPITYSAAPGEKAIISGGMQLDLKWKPYKDGIMQAEVANVKEGKIPFDQLFINGKRQRMARYPNFDPKAQYYGGTAADAISPERGKRWSNPVGAYVHALHRALWGDFHYRITGVDAKGNVKMEGGFQNNRRMGMHDKYRFVENVFEELDAPGEWYFDRGKGVLYFMPPEDVDLSKAKVEVAGIKHLIELRGSQATPVRFVTFKGLTLTHTARTFMEPYEPLLRSDWCIYRGGAVLLEGAEDCAISDSFFDAVGGNAIFVNNYNRRIEIARCKITEAGASGVCFVGDPKAVRSPSSEYDQLVPLDQMDREPGPRTPNYPAQCRVHDNLIHSIGQVEKQIAGVEISMSVEITVSHNTIYDVPRAGINIGDGTWGGHVLEFNDVFDTVKETGDHGSFNSWGRDRYWSSNQRLVNQAIAKSPDMPRWDAYKTTIIRNNRWRCDHGWDIDLDDGSTNYHIYNNLCLSGGLKLREGFYRTVENNIMVNNSFHPHVWFENSGDVFVRNIVATSYRPIRMPKVWGKQVDYNLFSDEASLKRSRDLGMDQHSAAGDPMFIDPAKGDYRVKDDSPAIKLGFKNFPMDQFGVLKPELRAEAKMPVLPTPRANPAQEQSRRDGSVHQWMGMKIRNIVGMGEVSAVGLPGEVGVSVTELPANSPAAKSGLQVGDVILKFNGQQVSDVNDLLRLQRAVPGGQKSTIGVFRNQQITMIALGLKGAQQ